MYSKHVEQLARETTALKQHNASLQQQLSDACAKMTAIDNENKYIRWENDNYKKEMESLKTRFNEEKHDLVALKSELRLIKKTNEDLRLTQSARLTEEIGSAISKKIAMNESLRRILKDREKEYGINLSRMHNEIDFLKRELNRKEELCKRFTRMLDKLTKDNQQLFNEIAVIRSAREQEVDKLNDALVRAEHEICEVRDSERILRGTVRQLEQIVETDRSSQECLTDVRQKLIMSSRNEQLDEANATIACLQKQVENLLAIQKIGPHYALVKSLKEKTLLVANLEENIRRLHVELEKEKEQRENSTTLLIEMGRDMRHLLALANDTD
ncbi:Laminin subunit beta-4 [Toxocara canis]|nr:Laminin subunit beta-4 [Toxocara canis]